MNVLLRCESGFDPSPFIAAFAGSGIEARACGSVLEWTMSLFRGESAVGVHVSGSTDYAARIVRDLRKGGIHAPVLSLVPGLPARDPESAGRIADVLCGGGDDVQPISIDAAELVARVHALARRGRVDPDEIVRFGELEMNRTQQVIRSCGTAMAFTRFEFCLLSALIDARGRICTRGAILERIYGNNRRCEKVVDVLLVRIRRKLAAAGVPVAIESVWGEGWRLAGEAP